MGFEVPAYQFNPADLAIAVAMACIILAGVVLSSTRRQIVRRRKG